MRRLIVLATFILAACGATPAAPAAPSADQLQATVQAAVAATSAAVAAAIPPCDTQTFVKTLTPIAAEWDDAVKLAGNTPRGSLAPQIASLQEIRRRAKAVEAPDCAAGARDALVASMDATVDGFLTFMGGSTADAGSEKFAEAAAQMTTYVARMASLSSPQAGATATAVTEQARILALTPTVLPSPTPTAMARVKDQVIQLYTAQGFTRSENNENGWASTILTDPNGKIRVVLYSSPVESILFEDNDYEQGATGISVFQQFLKAATPPGYAAEAYSAPGWAYAEGKVSTTVGIYTIDANFDPKARKASYTFSLGKQP